MDGYVEAEPIKVTQDKKECFICNKEVALALVGVGIGLLFVVLGLDTIRRIRKESTMDVQVVMEDD